MLYPYRKTAVKLPQSMPNADQNHVIDLRTNTFCEEEKLLAFIGIDRHWDQCQNFDCH